MNQLSYLSQKIKNILKISSALFFLSFLSINFFQIQTQAYSSLTNNYLTSNYSVLENNQEELKEDESFNFSEIQDFLVNQIKNINPSVILAPKTEAIPQNSVKNIKNQVNSTANLKSELASQTASPSIKIPAIGVETKLNYSSLATMDDLDAKMLYNPIVENRYAADACRSFVNTYIYGHSEPAVSSTKNYPGVYVFSRLRELKKGDKIYIKNANGENCTYEVEQWRTITTDSQGRIAKSIFRSLFYPDTSNGSLLSIQTCKKGSSTVRYVLVAKMV